MTADAPHPDPSLPPPMDAVGGADAVLMHKGLVRCSHRNAGKDVGLIVHLSASTMLSPQGNTKALVGTVEEGIKHGADCVSVHVNLGDPNERLMLADLGRVAAACDDWHMPLLAMMYARGPAIKNGFALLTEERRATGIFGIQIACQQTFVALGNAKISLFLAVLRKIILLIPFIYILPNFFADKAFAVFLAEPVADFLAVCTTATMFAVHFKKSMTALEGKPGV